jgi:hypothetical protein
LYLALQRKARADGRSTDELLQLAALEAFVDRLSTSARARDVVLKGGVLLAAYELRRPTRDVDLSATRVSNDVASVRALIDEILGEPRDDGWIYGASSAEDIREADVYSGVRVTVPCALARARIVFHVDVNIGDVVWPPPVTVSLPRLLGEAPIEVAGYSLSMILAEKLVTAVQRGIANTRWRDFADVYLMTGKHVVAGREVRESIRRVALHRRAVLVPRIARGALDGMGGLRRARTTQMVGVGSQAEPCGPLAARVRNGNPREPSLWRTALDGVWSERALGSAGASVA